MAGTGGNRAGMSELHAGCTSEVVHRFGEAREAGNRVVRDDDLARRALALLVDRAVRERRHPDAAHGDGAVVVDQPVGDDVLARHPLEGGGLDHAIAQRDRAQPSGRERPPCHSEEPIGAFPANVRDRVECCP